MARRTILLLTAVLVAALGTALVFVYVQGANDRALADQNPVKVLVAKTTIVAGTPAADASKSGAFELKQIAKAAAAPGAISDVAAIRDQVALANIYPGEQILAAKFGAPGDTSALPIPEGKLAVSVQLADPNRVAGFVQPGSEVAVFATMSGGGNTGGDFTRVLLPRVQVIAVGPTTMISTTNTNEKTGETNTEQLPKAILTLAVDQGQAQKVIYASQRGQLYFGLLTKKSNTAPGGPVTAGNLFQ